MGSKSYETDDALRNTLAIEVSEQVDMMEIWGWGERTGIGQPAES